MESRRRASSRNVTKDKLVPPTPSLSAPANIAVLIPCYNEERTIAAVVRGFRDVLPGAAVYVYDNNSGDGTCDEAVGAGAIVRHESAQGKGCVVRRMFIDIEADYYILVDGDDTYAPADAPRMVSLVHDGNLAMLVGRRVHDSAGAYPPIHVLGNKLLTGSVAALFGQSFTDMLSGYRVFSRPFVKSFPAFSRGFEIETELTVHALTLGLPIAEIATPYRARPAGSTSKLHTFSDGIRILWTIFRLFENERPLSFFGICGGLCLLSSGLLAWPIVIHFLETGLVPRFPTAILATGLALYALIMFACGLILDAVTKARRELKLLTYLNAQRYCGK